MALDDRERGGQAEPGASAGRLAGEERFEDSLEHRWLYSRAGVGHANDDVVA